VPQQPSSASNQRTYLVGCDAKDDIRVFSGITYHLAMQGAQDGLLTGMVNLYPRGIQAWRIFARAGWWKLRAGAGGRSGFKFTDGFLDGIWRQNLPMLRNSKVINNFQLFGSHFLRSHRRFGVVPYMYIDGTLREYFEDYRAFDTAKIGETAMHQAIAIEREGYSNCRKIIIMSNRSAAYIAQHYDVSRDKLHIVPPGANIPERLLATFDNRSEPCRRTGKRTLVVGFIGLYPERKGLATIAGAVQLLRGSGYDVRLHVIGKCPPEISQSDGITDFGLIDKRADTERFIEIVRNIDVGCMLSRAETAGIALLEFLRMGVPIIATDVGGIPDILGLGAGQLVSPEIRAEDLAQCLAYMIDQPDRLEELRAEAWRRRHNASWRRVVRELEGVLNQ
jgi:glycosyltransferase involved in cell wall biosynthesis